MRFNINDEWNQVTNPNHPICGGLPVKKSANQENYSIKEVKRIETTQIGKWKWRDRERQKKKEENINKIKKIHKR